MGEEKEKKSYRGRLAPTPSGYLHEGHARTFRIAWQRARANLGVLVFRNDDLDPSRCRAEFLTAAMEDLKSVGLDWDEGPDCGGKYGPYDQSKRSELYLQALEQLVQSGFVYPCSKSRREIRQAGLRSRTGEEFLFPREFRPGGEMVPRAEFPGAVNWRFRTEWKGKVSFADESIGDSEFEAGIDFSDFLVWRKDGVASYELATVVDDHAMGITEIVRGMDLLVSSARQCLLFDALELERPTFFHSRLLLDEGGRKLSKSERNLPRLFPEP